MHSKPLDLASPRWRELTQAYGAADDIPRLLAALATVQGDAERTELWCGVWATLCRDGRVYTAAYAAVPHLLDITHEHGIVEQGAAIHVAVEVETLRHTPGAPAIPDDLVLAYATAIDSLPARVAALVGHPWDALTTQVMAAALVAGKRQPALASAILAIGDDR